MTFLRLSMLSALLSPLAPVDPEDSPAEELPPREPATTLPE
jgi:hypothetical protein